MAFGAVVTSGIPLPRLGLLSIEIQLLPSQILVRLFWESLIQKSPILLIVGAVLDVVVDIRKNSPNYGQYFSVELNESNKLLLSGSAEMISLNHNYEMLIEVNKEQSDFKDAYFYSLELKRIQDSKWKNNYYVGLGLGQPSHDTEKNNFTLVEKVNVIAIESKLE